MGHSSEKIQAWLTRLVGHEGGYWDDPVGGPTKWGISQRSYPLLDIPSLTVDYAEWVYRRDYLNPLKVDRYSDGVAFQLLDFAVNSGVPNAVKTIQRVLKLEPDGVIGPITIGAIEKYSESAMAMIALSARLTYMTGLKNWPENSRGWARRIAKNLLYAVEDSD